MTLFTILYTVFIVLLVVMLLTILYSPYSNDCISNEYMLRSIQHNLPTNLKFSNNCLPLQVKESVLSDLVSMYSLVSELFIRQHITFWAVGETLLGARLVNGILPWRDRLELAVSFDSNQHKKLVSLRPTLLEYGYVLRKTSNSYRLCKKNWSSFPFIEINLMSERNFEMAVCSPLTELNECTYADSHFRRREIFEMSDIFPLTSMVFEDLTIPVPKHTDTCLKIMYGTEALQLVDATAYGDKVHVLNSLTYQLFGRC
jgi:hypothetical protein